jgi:predicted flap endonuclease-1-like 5' DNA nuclease
MDRSARTLLAVAFFTIAAFLAAELLIRRAPIGEWLLAGILALLGLVFLWLGERPERAPMAAVAAGEQQTELPVPLPSGMQIYDVVRAPAAAPVASLEHALVGDDLTILAGVDAATADILRAAGITTFAQLAELTPDELTHILGDAGEIVAGGHVEALLQQARLAADKNWPGLMDFATSLAAEPDDLVILDGVGPKIDATLKAAGIRTFAQVAAMTPEELRAVLSSAGVSAVGSSIDSWPQQARLAAAGDYPGLMRFIADWKKRAAGD